MAKSQKRSNREIKKPKARQEGRSRVGRGFGKWHDGQGEARSGRAEERLRTAF